MAQPGTSHRLADILSLRSWLSAAPSIRSTRKEPRGENSRVPQPCHRHASPSTPWPWIDLEDDIDKEQLVFPLPPIPPLCSHKEPECRSCWTDYPQSRFPNWTKRQIVKSKIDAAIYNYKRQSPCYLHLVDISDSGVFSNPGSVVARPGEESETWRMLIIDKRPEDIRVRTMFIENMSGPILQMLGAKYNMEPFFWSSSLNWTPTRYQEELQRGVGDHITIVLTFLHSMSNRDTVQLNTAFGESIDSLESPKLLGTQMIDSQAPLVLHSNDRRLVLDLLAVHLIRDANGSTVISFHPSLNLSTTTAPVLHERMQLAGQTHYWQRVFKESPDPTFVLLIFMWHVVHAWDQALANLLDHICTLEARVISTAEMSLMRELHVIRSYQLYYVSLLDDLPKHVEFIRDTHNPNLEHFPEQVRIYSKASMDKECSVLLSECTRLRAQLFMQKQRTKNLLDLVFSSVSITDSRHIREMTESAIRDSAGEWQIAHPFGKYIYVNRVCSASVKANFIFDHGLPSGFSCCMFGMNVKEIRPGSLGTLSDYFAAALPFVVFTVWIIIAVQSRYMIPGNAGFIKRLGWPVYLIIGVGGKKKPKELYGFDNDSEAYSMKAKEPIISRKFY